LGGGGGGGGYLVDYIHCRISGSWGAKFPMTN